MQEDAVGIVLAGGGSRRLAELNLGPAGKAGLVVGGATCLERVCRAVGSVVPRVLVVAAAGQPLPGLPAEVEIVRDASLAGGPLAGLRDGLRQAVGREPPPRWAFVTSCDAPLLSAAVVRLLFKLARSSAARVVVPLVDGHRQVLVSVMACDLLGSIEATVAVGGGVRAMVDRLRRCGSSRRRRSWRSTQISGRSSTSTRRKTSRGSRSVDSRLRGDEPPLLYSAHGEATHPSR